MQRQRYLSTSSALVASEEEEEVCNQKNRSEAQSKQQFYIERFGGTRLLPYQQQHFFRGEDPAGRHMSSICMILYMSLREDLLEVIVIRSFEGSS